MSKLDTTRLHGFVMQPFVMRIHKIRNKMRLFSLMLSMQQCVGQIRGVWYMCRRMEIDADGGATIVFVPRADRGRVSPLDRHGVLCGPFQVYAVADFKSCLWAIQKFCVA